MKKYATTILFVLFAVGLGIALWFDRDKVSEGERKLRTSNVFVAFRRDELSRIEIVHEGETIIVERDPKKDTAWRLVSPISGGADQGAVERLITTLEFATVQRKVTEGTGLGFEEPRAAGRITMGTLATRFTLGGTAPRPEGAGYFRVDDGAPFVVSSELVQALLQPADTYRDRSILPYLSIELARFEVQSPASPDARGFVLERKGGEDDASEGGNAFLVASEGVLASREALDRVWGALAEMRADHFVKPEDVAKYMEHPALTLTMTPKNAGRPPAVLLVAGSGEGCPEPQENVLVLRKTPNPTAVCVPKSSVEALHAQPSELVEKHPFTLRADEIEELRLEGLAPGSEAAIEFARKGNGFHERSPVDHDMTTDEDDAAGTLLDRIVTSEATQATRGPVHGPNDAAFVPVARAKIRSGDSEQVVELGPPRESDGVVVARRVIDDARLELPGFVARRFLPRKTSLKPRVLLGDSRRVTRVSLRCGVPQEIAIDDTGVHYLEPKGFEVDASILDLVSALTRGRVDAWVADAAEPSFELSESRGSDDCRVTLGFEDGKDPREIVFGAEGEGGVYGKVANDPAVFVVPRSFRALAARVYVSRAYLRASSDEIASVSVTSDGKPVTLLDPYVAKEAVAALYADRVLPGKGLATSARTPNLTIEVRKVAGSDAGSAGRTWGVQKIACTRTSPSEWRCETPRVAATFVVADRKLAPLLGPQKPPSGDVADDAGPR